MFVIEYNQLFVVDLFFCVLIIRFELELELEIRVEILGLVFFFLMISIKGEDKDILMFDYIDSERNDDSELGGEEIKRF